jgi:hypothetical protein
MSNVSSVSPSFQAIRKSPLGNDYEATNKASRVGAFSGLGVGTAYALWELDRFKGKKMTSSTLMNTEGKPLVYRTTENRRNFIKTLKKDFNMTLKSFGGKPENRVALRRGFTVLAGAIALSGMFVGAMIGKAIDSHNNHKFAKQADAKAQSSK